MALATKGEANLPSQMATATCFQRPALWTMGVFLIVCVIFSASKTNVQVLGHRVRLSGYITTRLIRSSTILLLTTAPLFMKP
jgi:hypothetical protein